jgi:hypothetical protein
MTHAFGNVPLHNRRKTDRKGISGMSVVPFILFAFTIVLTPSSANANICAAMAYSDDGRYHWTTGNVFFCDGNSQVAQEAKARCENATQRNCNVMWTSARSPGTCFALTTCTMNEVDQEVERFTFGVSGQSRQEAVHLSLYHARVIHKMRGCHPHTQWCPYGG